MPMIIPNLDTIKYPSEHEPKLILSVSDDPFLLRTGVGRQLDLYVEKLELGSNLLTTVSDDGALARLGLFVDELVIPATTPTAIEVGVCGANGDSEVNPGGQCGGTLDLYVEAQESLDAGRLRFDCHGGDGFSPLSYEKVTTGSDAGNGGNGGRVRILFDNSWGSVATATSNLFELARDESRPWPSGFLPLAEDFLDLISQDRIRQIYRKPALPTTVEGVLQGGKPAFRSAVKELLMSLPLSLPGEQLSRTINVTGGVGGRGSRGSVASGKSGQRGEAGDLTVMPVWEIEKLVRQEVCFVHPVQCRMLLEKANFLYYCGSLESKAKSTQILQRLQKRLAPFEMCRLPPFPKLWEAYRQAESRLYIISGPVTEEPVSISQLRAVAREVTATLQRISSGIDFYGHRQDEVPRCSYTWYSSRLTSLLTYITEIQGSYAQQFNQSVKVSRDLGALSERLKVSNDSYDNQNSLLEEAKRTLLKAGKDVQIFTEAVTAGKNGLLQEVHTVERRIQSAFNIPFEDLLDAVSQVFFIQASPSTGGYLALQSNPILNVNELRKQFRRQLDYVQRDDAVDVKRQYLLRQVREVSNGLRDLCEGYQAADDRSLSLDDPDGVKLCLQQSTLEDILRDFSQALGENTLKSVKEKFNSFVTVVTNRNAAVLQYNSTLSQIDHYQAQLASLRVQARELTRAGYEKLDLDHPSLTAFLLRVYRDMIRTCQLWLARAQQAFKFLSLKDVNVMGGQLDGGILSQSDPEFLKSALSALTQQHAHYLESNSLDAQSAKGVRYELPPDTVERLRQAGGSTQGAVGIDITIAPDDPVFKTMYDIRLMTVRFFIPGVHTANDELRVYLTHAGNEMIKNAEGRMARFTHDSLTVTFWSRLPYNEEFVIADGSIGLNIDDTYARVGPFTHWRVELPCTEDINPKLDLTGIEKAFLEFDLTFRTSRRPIAG